MRVLVFLLFFQGALSVIAQHSKGSFTSKDSLYNANIKKTKLYGVYIPRDPEDAVQQLMLLTTPESREPFKKADEETVAKKLHFGLGRWMEYNWNFEEGSRLSHYFRNKGLRYTEDMTRCMLILFHRHVCGKPADLDALIDEIIKKRKEWELLNSRQNVIIDSFKRSSKG
jgi:hypothetical protein